MNIQHVVDPVCGVKFVSESLQGELGLSLSKGLSKELCFDKASFVSFASNKIEIRQLIEFTEGGKFEVQPDPNILLENFISTNCSQNGFWIIEGWLAKPTDRFLVEMKMPFVTYGNEVYYIVKNSEKGCNWDAVMSNRPPAFHAFYGVFEFDEPRKKFNDVDLKNISKSIEAIVLGVYDGESFLVCKL